MSVDECLSDCVAYIGLCLCLLMGVRAWRGKMGLKLNVHNDPSVDLNVN